MAWIDIFVLCKQGFGFKPKMLHSWRPTKSSCNHLTFPHAPINTTCNLHPQVGHKWHTFIPSWLPSLPAKYTARYIYVYVIAWFAVQFGMNCTSNATSKVIIAPGEAECNFPSWLHYECNSSQQTMLSQIDHVSTLTVL